MFMRCSVSIIAIIIILFVLQPILAITFFVGFGPLIYFALKFGWVMKDIAVEISNEKAKMSNIADESLSNVRTVKAFANESEEVSKFNKHSDLVFGLGRKKACVTGIFGLLIQLTLYGAMILIVYVAGELYKRNEVSIGLISTFLFYLMTLRFNFWILQYAFASAANVVGASEKIIKIITLERKINTTGGLKPEGEVEGCLTLKNLKFTYPSKKDVQVLKGVDIAIDNKKNRVVALCGTSGCGKSSIISMIERFYDPEDGEVLFNGINIKDLDPRWYHEQVVIVQQEPVLFSGSIRSNLLYGLDWEGKVDEDEIVRRMD